MIDKKKTIAQHILGALFCLEGILTLLIVISFAVYKYLYS